MTRMLVVLAAGIANEYMKVAVLEGSLENAGAPKELRASLMQDRIASLGLIGAMVHHGLLPMDFVKSYLLQRGASESRAQEFLDVFEAARAGYASTLTQEELAAPKAPDMPQTLVEALLANRSAIVGTFRFEKPAFIKKQIEESKGSVMILDATLPGKEEEEVVAGPRSKLEIN